MRTRMLGNLSASPMLPFLAGGLMMLLHVSPAPGATQAASILRQGSFETLTDVGARDVGGNTTNSNTIERFLMSADGSTAVYAMTQDPLVGPCTSNRQIRRVDIETGQDDLVGGCTENLRFEFTSFDVSDDGSRIVYIRETVADNPEIVRCEFSGTSCAKTVTLQMIATGPGTSLWISPHDADDSQGSLVLSGDGSKIFFRNNFTWGSIGRFSGPVTIYQVDAVSGVAAILFKFSDLATVAPPLTANTNFVLSLHAVDFTGSTMVFDSRAPSPTVGWHDVSVIDTSVGLASIKSIAQNQDICCRTAQPDISSDGRTVVYARLPGNPVVQTGGVHVQRLNTDLTPAGSAIVVDPDALAVRPCLSADGTTVALYDDTAGGDNHVRMTTTESSLLRNVSWPAIEMPTLAACRIQGDGTSLLLHGIVKTEVNTFGLPRELLLFRWNTSLEVPSVLGVTADPTVWLAKDSFTLHPWMYHTYFWDVAFSVGGSQLKRGYTALFDGGAQENLTVYGDDSSSGFLDDGTNHDRVAGDDIYTNPFIWVDHNYPSTDPTFPFPDAPVTLRFGIAASNGTATHVDVELPIFPEAIESAQISSLNTSPTPIGSTRVTLSFDTGECCEVTAQLFDYPPPGSQGSTGELWRIFSGAPQGFFGGSGITSAPYAATLTFGYTNVTDPGMISLYRTRDGVTWEEVASSVDAPNGEITTAIPIDDIDGLWAIGEGLPVLATLIFFDGFESGDIGAWQ